MFVTEADKPPLDRGASGADERPLEVVERELTELCAHLNAATGRWLELIGEFDRRDGWMAYHGCRSCADWLAWQCALAPRVAREHVRVARALPALPAVRAALCAGQLSFSKVRAITRIATPDSEEDLLELARHATAAQLERMIRAARRATSQEALDAHERAYCLWYWEDEGSLTIRAQLPAEEGAAFIKSMEAASDVLREQRIANAATHEEGPDPAFRGSAEPRNAQHDEAERPEQRWPTRAECLAYVSESALDQLAGGSDPADRHQVMIHVDESFADERCHVRDGPAIAGDTARRLACDAGLVPVVEGRDGSVLSVGRRSRTVPTAIRRALEVRDGGCRFPGCEQRRFTDSHHVRHWADGGQTALSNLLLLCRRHHRLVHEGGYRIDWDPGDEPIFRDRFGAALPAAPPMPRVRGPSLERRNREAGLEIGPDTTLTGTGERMDLGLCVDAVLAAPARSPAPP